MEVASEMVSEAACLFVDSLLLDIRREVGVSVNMAMVWSDGPLDATIATNPCTIVVEVYQRTGGKSRTKTPKPWQESVEIVDHH
jgi:hypothetical protein